MKGFLNGAASKILTTVMAALLLTAIIGGYSIKSDIDALTVLVKAIDARQETGLTNLRAHELLLAHPGAGAQVKRLQMQLDRLQTRVNALERQRAADQ